jgi:hypothetical protein
LPRVFFLLAVLPRVVTFVFLETFVEVSFFLGTGFFFETGFFFGTGFLVRLVGFFFGMGQSLTLAHPTANTSVGS